uniref:Uncharacterized protein n=1 Tax=Tanacetum cinerariifolium TaxID=118510 RepID=A0A699S9E3_TANCI|nr:hypothetical protein [Tanacetum cinerariifolium]
MELEKENSPVSVTLVHPGRIDTPYNEHARSYLDKQPSHRGMVYPPEAVAEAILFSAAHPKRDMYVGFQAKIFTLLAPIIPSITDKVMEAWMYPSQHDERPSRSREDNALYQRAWHPPRLVPLEQHLCEGAGAFLTGTGRRGGPRAGCHRRV